MKKHSKSKSKKKTYKANAHELRQSEISTVAETKIEMPPVVKSEDLELTGQELTHVLEASEEQTLASAKTLWFFGEWQQLIDLDFALCSVHPERDRFALLVASAHQQLNNHEKARSFTRKALEWGCPHGLVAQVLIAGVHNTLGRVAALKQDKERTTSHFEAAVSAIETRDMALVSHARSVSELSKLGLLSNVVGLIDEDISHLARYKYYLGRQRAAIDLVRQEQLTIKAALGKKTDQSSSETGKRLILVASIPRSGSTWVFNCVKKILCKYNESVYSCWVEDYDSQNESLIHLVKVHDPASDLANQADVILSTRRDIREVAASLVRMGWDNKGENFIQQIQHIAYIVHPFWYERSTLEIEYEQTLQNSMVVIEQIGHVLGHHLSLREVAQLEAYLSQLKDSGDYDKETQLHPRHRATEIQSCEDILGSERLKIVTHAAEKWLADFKYLNN